MNDDEIRACALTNATNLTAAMVGTTPEHLSQATVSRIKYDVKKMAEAYELYIVSGIWSAPAADEQNT